MRKSSLLLIALVGFAISFAALFIAALVLPTGTMRIVLIAASTGTVMGSMLLYSHARRSWIRRETVESKQVKGRIVGIEASHSGELITVEDSEGYVHFLGSDGTLKGRVAAGEGAYTVAVSPAGKLVGISTLADRLLILDGDGRETGSGHLPEGGELVLVSEEANLVLASSGSELLSFRPDGTRAWNRAFDHSISDASMSPDGRLIAIGSWSKEVFLVDSSGKILWRRPVGAPLGLGGSPRAGAIARRGKLVITVNYDTDVIALDGNGVVKWRSYLGAFPHSTLVSDDGSLVVVHCVDDSLRAFGSDGRLTWKLQLDAIARVSLTSDGSRVSVSGKPFGIRIIGRKGEILWQKEPSDGFLHAVLLRDGTGMIAGTMSGEVWRFTPNGEKVWSKRIESAGVAAVASHKGQSVTQT